MAPVEQTYIQLQLATCEGSSEMPWKYLIWRRSMLQWALCPLLVVTMAWAAAEAYTRDSDQSLLGKKGIFPDSSRMVWEARLAISRWMPVIQAGIELIGYGYAFLHWKCFWRSKWVGTATYLISFYLPVLTFLLPWVSLFNVEQNVVETCKELPRAALLDTYARGQDLKSTMVKTIHTHPSLKMASKKKLQAFKALRRFLVNSICIWLGLTGMQWRGNHRPQTSV
eukprot:6477943-Amphidinium_carterae.1